MFGYVTICKEHLSEEGFKTFQSYYCGLCREIGRRCSHAARLGLSYDITFLAIILSSLDTDGETNTRRCFMKMGKKHECVENDRAVMYAADMGVILTYLKLLDDWHDEKSIKVLCEMQLFRGAVKKAKSRYPKTYDGIKTCLDKLSALEKEKCGSVDETADCFAKILEVLFTPDFITDEAQRRSLAWLGYNVGRWIYIIDAYNDLEKDRKNGSYNPFIYAEGAELSRISESLTFTLENAASAYNLLEIKRNSEVTEHILYTALALKQRQILGETNESI